MTSVQQQSLPEIMKGIDCLAKAKTGTGKTLGFLIPTVEIISKMKQGGNPVCAIVISPTRELASQIAAEAEALTKFHNMKVVCVIGGSNINSDYNKLKNRVDLLIATPGRLNDHLSNTKGFAERCRVGIKVLIMDEADQLLDMGFKPEIDKILAKMPAQKERQTLLFSATVPNSVKQIADKALSPGYVFVDTVGEETEQTHEHVQQFLSVLPLDEQIIGINAIISSFTKNTN
mmetsp:Transcript_27904/g.23405  ORF Transcript_27904/g.23405 Transcript_27904/m.23405 type:complete len:232 (+) Transcript_27904:608-1303(+)